MGRSAVLAMPWIAAGLALALVAMWLASREREREPARASLDVASLLGANTGEGFQRAEAPREFAFPRDHAAHEGFKTEWWYFTGNLRAESGRRFGYQLTFFRSALAGKAPQRSSTFAADHVWMAHLALSDIEGKDFTSFERFGRESGAIAGASADPVSVWLKDWRCDFSPDGLPIRLVAREGKLAIELSLRSAKPVVLQGDRGLSQKSAGAGNASYYYSLTRLETTGAVRVGDTSFEVRGLSWMDREWSSGELGQEQIGWDWFALQLDDGSELMWYRLRHADGSLD
ncbi:MAG: carotenoid 1,2-hydratase, partial [Planctomycetota bacterium]